MYYKLHQRILDEAGYISAAVFGLIESRANDGICHITQAGIGNSLHLSRATIRRAVKRLVESGYIEVTPGSIYGARSYEILWSVSYCK